MTYCTYLTVYSGNKLPPFYIGYKKIEDVNNGYRGSVASNAYQDTWEFELKNSPHLFKTFILTKHSSREEAKKKETYFQNFFKVHKNPMYINLSISGEKFYLKKHSSETKRKLSIANTGKIMSPESRTKMSLSKKAMTEETKRKLSKINTGKKLSDETKGKISEAGKRWIRSPMSVDQKGKIAKAITGKKLSNETKTKISISMTGKIRPQSAHDKLSRKVSDGEKEFKSIKEAAQYHNKSPSTISNRVKKNLYGWKYV